MSKMFFRLIVIIVVVTASAAAGSIANFWFRFGTLFVLLFVGWVAAAWIEAAEPSSDVGLLTIENTPANAYSKAWRALMWRYQLIKAESLASTLTIMELGIGAAKPHPNWPSLWIGLPPFFALSYVLDRFLKGRVKTFHCPRCHEHFGTNFASNNLLHLTTKVSPQFCHACGLKAGPPFEVAPLSSNSASEETPSHTT